MEHDFDVGYCKTEKLRRGHTWKQRFINGCRSRQTNLNKTKIVVLLLLTACIVMVVLWRSQAVPAVKVEVYFESLCPDSKSFIANQLWLTYKKLSTKIVRFEMFPYGNVDKVKKDGKWNFDCQHGPRECLLNKVEACVLEYASYAQSIEYIHCLEKDVNMKTAERCVPKDLSWEKIKACSEGEEGQKLFEIAGNATPNHTFIPWIVVNGKSGDDIQKAALDDLLDLVCASYTGSSSPVECTKKLH